MTAMRATPKVAAATRRTRGLAGRLPEAFASTLDQVQTKLSVSS
jgi:hypothetical protein